MLSKLNREHAKSRQPYATATATASETHPPTEGGSGYASAIKSVKKDTITGENIGQIMLMCVPGVSAASAAVILEPFDGSVPKLVVALQADRNCLAGTKLNGRRISSTVIAAVVEYLGGPAKTAS